MTKAEFVKAVADKTGLSLKASAEASGAFIDVVKECLHAGDRISFPGFGAFSVFERSARKGRNLHTGAEIDIPAAKNGKFSAGKDLKNL